MNQISFNYIDIFLNKNNIKKVNIVDVISCLAAVDVTLSYNSLN